jgi:DNA polymerase-3 subunit alpha
MHNIFRLSSLSSLEGYFRKPRMDRELLAAHAGGIIATTGLSGLL